MAGFNASQSASAPTFRVALFGPQATRWSQASLGELQSKLNLEHKLGFVTKTIAGLSSVLPVFEKVGSASGTAHVCHEIEDLRKFATESSSLDPQALSNAQLAVLTVASHVVELFEKTDRFEKLFQFAAAQGFCTGLLSATALSLSHTQAEFEHYASTAIRLAACTGFIVDDEDATHDPPGRATAVSVRWKTAAERSHLDTLLEMFPEIYVSCFTDERALTATISKENESEWCSRLAEANITTSAVGLSGCYHHHRHSKTAQKLKQLCTNHNQLGFPTVDSLALPLRSSSDASVLESGSLHELVIDMILCRKAHWHRTVQATNDSAPQRPATFITVGKGSFLPRSVSAKATRTVSENDVEEIAVVGMACRFPQADSLEEFWELLESGSTSISKLPTERFDPLHIHREPKAESLWGNFLERPADFDHRFFGISGREAKSMDPQQRLALQVAYEALESSGYCGSSSTKQETDVGCYLGVGSVDYNDNVGSENANAFSATGTLRAFISGRISHFFGWIGPSITFDTACSSSAVAIHTACRALIGGECSMALAGGVNVITSPDLHQNLAAASFLNPNGSSRAFDANAGGYCRGEGAGLLVLKPLSRAVADGDSVLGVISGSAVNQGSNCSSITVPDSDSQAKLYMRALAQGHLQPTQVSYVEAHGTGTQVGDPIEYSSVQRALTSAHREESLFLGSVKDNIGHCEAASGAAGLVKTILMIQKSLIPKQANFETLNPKINTSSAEMITIPKITQPWLSGKRVALVNNYGAAGSNAAIVVRKHTPSATPPPKPDLAAYPFLISAKSLPSLQAYISALKQYTERTDVAIKDLSYNLCSKQNPSFEHRASFVAGDAEALNTALIGAAARGESATALPVVLTFGGQTGRKVTVTKQAYENSDLLRLHLDRCDAACKDLGLSSIFPGIFEEKDVEDLVSLHCQLLSLQVASARSWIDSGVKIDTVVGHSFGQISALCVAGSLSLHDAMKFVSGRARLISDSWGPENGIMLSVECDSDQLQSLVAEVSSVSGLSVSIACYNGPKSFVLAGGEASISRAEECAQPLKAIRIGNSHAYHSHLVDSIMPDLTTLASSVKIKSPLMRFESCSEEQCWPEYIADNLSQHTRQPVYFSAAVERISSRLPCAIWLEAGSASPVTTLVRRVLRNSNRSDIFVPVDIGSANAINNLAHATTQLWQAGVGAAFWPFCQVSRSEYQNLNLPPYQFERTQHWMQYKPRLETREARSLIEFGGSRERGLMTLLKHEPDTGSALFGVHTSDAIFDLACRGHAVTGQSLCPASMYVELALSGVTIIQGEAGSNSRPNIEGLTMSNPLGLGNASSVFVRLHKEHTRNAWRFTIFSQPAPSETWQVNRTEHAKGLVSLISNDDIVAETRLKLLRTVARYSLAGRIIDSSMTTGIRGSMVYQVFSSVVDYAGYFQGVKSIASLENEAVGTVVVPSERPFGLSTVICDPISLDNFLQVAGIHVNCLSPRTSAEVFVCTAIDELIFTDKFVTDRSTERSWTVHTRFDNSSKGSVNNDIFVYDAKSKDIVVAIMGAQFKSVPFKSLAKSLSNLNSIKSTPTTRSASVNPLVDDSENGSRATLSPASELSDENSDTRKLQIKEALHDITPKVCQMFSDVIEIPLQDIRPESTLEYLGIDSLLVTEVLTEIETRFQIVIGQAEIMECETVGDLCKVMQPDTPDESEPKAVATPNIIKKQQQPPQVSIEQTKISDAQNGLDLASIAYETFANLKSVYDVHATSTKFSGYHANVFQLQSKLVITYVVEAFSKLGIELANMKVGDEVPTIPFQPQHSKLIPQLYLILADGGLVVEVESKYRRTSNPVPDTPSKLLHASMLEKHPQHSSETKLLSTTAPSLAQCLIGKVDPISLIFKDAATRATLEDVYTNAPMFKTGTLLLVDYLESIMERADRMGTVKILELGGGTGGTTKQLVEKLASLNTKQKFTYTFTDLSSSLVVAARRKFSAHAFMEYRTMDIEREPAPELLQKYDIVISTNCIHATKSLVESTTNIRKMLQPSGILCLIELTRNLFWFDLVFGLLEGWWLFNDDRKHALASEKFWKKDLQAAGFNWVDWSNTSSTESDVLRVITASPSNLDDSHAPKSFSTSKMEHSGCSDTSLQLKETFTFKQVDGLDLEADIYYPSKLVESEQGYPVALMIHGGGHVMLSRQDIRPRQTQMLINRGFIPISIDYRLCPEVTLFEGPMTDVADALAWIRTRLPKLRLSRSDVRVDGNLVAAIGWSTGGTLAMSLAWNSLHRGTSPPEVILALYCPTDYEDLFWTAPNIPKGSKTAHNSVVDLDEATWAGVFDRPIKEYNVPSTRRAVGGWLAPADARSRIALYMNHQGRTLHTLLNGLDKKTHSAAYTAELPSSTEIAAVSPLAQVRSGSYRVPTFIIHPRKDDLIPWQQAERMIRSLQAQNVSAELRVVEDVPHLFDTYRDWQSNKVVDEAVRDGYDFLAGHIRPRSTN